MSENHWKLLLKGIMRTSRASSPQNKERIQNHQNENKKH